MKEKASPYCAVIGDLVGSRDQPSRGGAQRDLLAALEVVNGRVGAVQPLEPTIGDEVQAVYESLPDALTATAMVRLALPEGMDCRFGIGVGTLEIVGASAYGLTQDGPAWWSAREAIEEVKSMRRQLPGLRTRIVGDGSERDLRMANAYLVCRDELVSAFDGRNRRIALGVLEGRKLSEIAEQEGISASAVSQRHRSGVSALVESVSGVTA